jgi:hypothetical protein
LVPGWFVTDHASRLDQVEAAIVALWHRLDVRKAG